MLLKINLKKKTKNSFLAKYFDDPRHDEKQWTLMKKCNKNRK